MTQYANGPKTLFNTLLTDIKKTDVEGVGTRRQEGDKWYRWVKNDSGAALAAGYQVCYQEDDGEAYHEVVYKPASANLHTLAGVAISAIEDYDATDATKKCYGWIQIEGYNTTVQVAQYTDTAIAAGDILDGKNAVWYVSRYGAGSAGRSHSHQSQSIASVANTTLSQAVASKSATSPRLRGYLVAASAVATSAAASRTSNSPCWIHCLNV